MPHVTLGKWILMADGDLYHAHSEEHERDKGLFSVHHWRCRRCNEPAPPFLRFRAQTHKLAEAR